MYIIHVYIYIYIYIYIYRSEGFPGTGYFIPGHVGWLGAGQAGASFRRRRPRPGLAWPFWKNKYAVFNFGMVSGASAVHGMIRLEKLISTNEFSRPHLLWHARIFK